MLGELVALWSGVSGLQLTSLIRLSAPAQVMVCVIKILVYAFSQVPLGGTYEHTVEMTFFFFQFLLMFVNFTENLVFIITESKVWPLTETKRCCSYLGLVFRKWYCCCLW